MRALSRFVGALGSAVLGVACAAILDIPDVPSGSDDEGGTDASRVVHHDAGTGSGSGHQRADASGDSGSADAGQDGPGSEETGVSMCHPHALPSGFEPMIKSPAVASACTPAENHAIAACLTSPGASTCPTMFQGDGGPTRCSACVFMEAGAPAWGPFVTQDGTLLGNVGGCVAVVDPTETGVTCGGAMDRVISCAEEACFPYCLGSPAGGAACLTGDIDNLCASYTATANMFCGDAGTTPGDCQTLFNAAIGDATSMEAFIGLFCGGADAGL